MGLIPRIGPVVIHKDITKLNHFKFFSQVKDSFCYEGGLWCVGIYNGLVGIFFPSTSLCRWKESANECVWVRKGETRLTFTGLAIALEITSNFE